MLKCFSTLNLLISLPTLTPILSSPFSGRAFLEVAATILSNSFSVACNNYSLFFFLSAANKGFRQAINLSPG